VPGARGGGGGGAAARARYLISAYDTTAAELVYELVRGPRCWPWNPDPGAPAPTFGRRRPHTCGVAMVPGLLYPVAALAVFLVNLAAATHQTSVSAPRQWQRRHMALSDRGLQHVTANLSNSSGLSNVIGSHSVGWNTDHHHCPWNSSASARPSNQTCISSTPAKVLASIQNETWRQGRPHVFTLSAMFDPTIPGLEPWAGHTADGYYTPFLDTWTRGLALRVRLWFAEYKRLGGFVDVVLLDFEGCDYLNAGRMAAQRNHANQSKFGTTIVSMPGWPALKAELEEMGAAFGATFSDADLGEMKTWGRDQRDFRQYVWNAVVVSLTTARALNASVVEPIRALYPDVHISNYAHNYHTAGSGLRTGGAGCCNWAYHFNEERHSVAFGGSHVGTHASHSVSRAVSIHLGIIGPC
jgi:hypothetical protein